MVGAREAAVAVSALERLVARVLPVVPRELVAARKPPVAVRPGALIGFFASVRPKVSLQVTALRVDFATTLHREKKGHSGKLLGKNGTLQTIR